MITDSRCMLEERIRDLVATGELERALAELLHIAATNDPALADQARLLSLQLAELERQTALGTASEENRAVKRARIAQGVLYLVRTLGEDEAPQARAIAPAPQAIAIAASSAPPSAQPAAFAPLRIFVSYAHEGDGVTAPRSAWLDALLLQLKPLVREGLAIVWSDGGIPDGRRFDEVIRSELERADAAVLLVSARFLASDYIYRREVPAVLDRWQQGRLTIYIVVLDPCAVASTRFKFPDPDHGPHEVALGELQLAHPPERPLSSLGSVDANRVLLGLADKLRALARSAC